MKTTMYLESSASMTIQMLSCSSEAKAAILLVNLREFMKTSVQFFNDWTEGLFSNKALCVLARPCTSLLIYLQYGA